MGNHQDTQRTRAAIISIFVGTTLMAFKFWAFEITKSKAIFSDALESIINVVAAIVALIVLKISSKPADEDHPYGHGKAEFFSLAFEGGFIAFAAFAIMAESVRTLFFGVELERLKEGFYIVLGTGAVNGILGFYLRHQGHKLQSMTLIANGQHILSDFWTSAALGAAVLLVQLTGLKILDPIVAILFSIQLGYTGYKLVRQSFSGLMDEEDRKVIEQLGALFQKYVFPGIIRIHYTRVLRAGRFHHIDAHVVVPEYWDVTRAHDETKKFESMIMKDYSTSGEIAFHVDPCRRFYCRACDVKDCPVRKEPFKKRIPFTLQELTSPTEPEEF